MSDAYDAFLQRAFLGAITPSTWRAALVNAYTFNAGHDSFAADITGVLDAPVYFFAETAPSGYRAQARNLVLPFSDSVGRFPASTIRAVVIYQGDVPLLHLDDETFPELPLTTGGGEVLVTFTSGVNLVSLGP